MQNTFRQIALKLVVLFIGLVFPFFSAFASGDHKGGHKEEKKEMQEMQHHHSSSKEEFTLPPGTKEVKINLSGPFCHKHPEEITEGLMQLAGVVHVEAFSGRRYILVHYNGDKAKPDEMATIVNGLKGSGWRCKGILSSKRRTER